MVWKSLKLKLKFNFNISSILIAYRIKQEQRQPQKHCARNLIQERSLKSADLRIV